MTAPTVLAVTVAELDVVNTSAETDFLSYTVAGGVLGSTGALRVVINADYLNNSGGTRTLQIKIKYGSTTLYDDTTGNFAANASRCAMTIEFVLHAKNATNSQGLGGLILIHLAGGATTGVGDLATDEIQSLTPLIGVNASEDSTTSLALKVTVKHSTNNASLSVRKLYSVVEKLI